MSTAPRSRLRPCTAGLALLAACGPALRPRPTVSPAASIAPAPAPSPVAEVEVARSGCMVLRSSALERRMQLLQAPQGGAAPLTRDELRDRMLREHPLERLCSEYGIVVDEALVDRAVQEIQRENHLSDAQLDAQLATRQLSRTEYRALVATEFRRARLLERWSRREGQVDSGHVREALERMLEVTRVTGEVRVESLVVGGPVRGRTPPAALRTLALELARRAHEGASLESLASTAGTPRRFEPATESWLPLASLSGPEGDALTEAPEGALVGPLLAAGRLTLWRVLGRRGDAPPTWSSVRATLERARYEQRRELELEHFDAELLRQALATTAATVEGRCVETAPPRRALRAQDLALRGNTTISTEELLHFVDAGGAEARLFGPLGELPLRLVASLQAMYADYGFLQLGMDYVLPEPGSDPAPLTLVLDEGPRYHLGRVRLTELDRAGHESAPPAERAQPLQLRSGQWFSRTATAAELASLRQRYRTHGAPAAEPEVDLRAYGELSEPTIELAFRVRLEPAAAPQ